MANNLLITQLLYLSKQIPRFSGFCLLMQISFHAKTFYLLDSYGREDFTYDRPNGRVTILNFLI